MKTKGDKEEMPYATARSLINFFRSCEDVSVIQNRRQRRDSTDFADDGWRHSGGTRIGAFPGMWMGWYRRKMRERERERVSVCKTGSVEMVNCQTV